MVAITVILAAVIGVFVLGLGDELGESAPTSQVSLNVEDFEGASLENIDISVSHDGGDDLDTDDLELVVRDDGDRIGDTTNFEDRERISVGDSFTLTDVDIETLDGGDDDGIYDVQLIHEPSNSIIAETDFEFEHDN